MQIVWCIVILERWYTLFFYRVLNDQMLCFYVIYLFQPPPPPPPPHLPPPPPCLSDVWRLEMFGIVLSFFDRTFPFLFLFLFCQFLQPFVTRICKSLRCGEHVWTRNKSVLPLPPPPPPPPSPPQFKVTWKFGFLFSLSHVSLFSSYYDTFAVFFTRFLVPFCVFPCRINTVVFLRPDWDASSKQNRRIHIYIP